MSDEPQEVGLYHRFELLANPSKKALFCGSVASADAAEKLVGADYITTALPEVPGAWQYADLTPLLGRTLLLLPDGTPDSRQDIGRLASRCSAIGCTFRLIDATDRPVDWTVEDWTEGEIAFRKWAGGRLHDWEPPERATASPEEPPPLDPAELPPVQEDASTPAPRSRRPNLAVVNGNAVRAARPDADPLPAPMSEVALGKHFAEEYGQDWRHVKEWGQWFKWNADRWEADKTNQAERLAIEVTCQALQWAEAGVLTPKDRRQVTKKSTAWAVRDVAATQAPIAASVEQWDTDALLLGVPGGVIDLRDGKMLDAKREYYITKCTATAPQRGPHPLWDKVLARATGNDATLTHYLAKWAGYMLTGDTREEAFLFVHGPGGSGKSTFVQVLRDCMGSYAKAARIETFMSTRHDEHPTELADLAGARLVSAPETDEGSRWNEGRIKMLTGRDKVKARFMNRDYFEFNPACKIMIFGNHRPRLYSVGEEMKRRIHMVEFPNTIPEEERDSALKLAIREEYPAILAWMLEGCLAWQQEGLGRPESVSQATDDYLSSQDTLGSWIDECCTRSQEARCMVSGAYRSFENWAKQRGEYVPSVTVFSEKIQARGIVKRKVSVMYFLGLALKATDELPPGRYPD